MPLNLYRRHRQECETGHAAESRSGEFEERKKGWKKCACQIFASGTLKGKFKRRYTGRSDWNEAKAVAYEWEKAGSWERDVPVPVIVTETTSDSKRTTIDRAVKTFLDELRESAAFATHKKYRLLLDNKFRAFSEKRGYLMVDQWEPLDVREFRSSWNVSPATAVRNMAMLKPFFEWCLNNEWIGRNPARLVKNPKGRDVTREEQKLPFTDEELKRMYDACHQYGLKTTYRWNGDDLSDFISLSIYTGLRISDVALFHIDRMLPTGEILIRTTKAGTHVYTWVPEWLQERIQARAKTHGPLIFGSHKTKTLEVITEGWRRKLKKLWKLCGTWKETPTPHRFRHTFARILLQKQGVTVRDVAELLGNTEDVVRRAYSAWVPERQERLTRILKDAFQDKPKPKVVGIGSRR
ncbi:MAG TPA: tyrosine-type recombinase/integrase [Terriglobia bacterium]|jgi:integrase